MRPSPRAFISGSTASVVYSGPQRCDRPWPRAKSSSVMDSSGPTWMTPALLMSTSTRAEALVHPGHHRATTCTGRARRTPRRTRGAQPRQLRAGALQRAASRPQRATRAPLRANSRASTNPSPREPPVTSTTLPSRRKRCRSSRRAASSAAVPAITPRTFRTMHGGYASPARCWRLRRLSARQQGSLINPARLTPHGPTEAASLPSLHPQPASATSTPTRTSHEVRSPSAGPQSRRKSMLPEAPQPSSVDMKPEAGVAASGEMEIYTLSGGNLVLASRQQGVRSTWDLIVPGSYVKFGEHTDLLFYDRKAGLGAFYGTGSSGGAPVAEAIHELAQGLGHGRPRLLPGEQRSQRTALLQSRGRERGSPLGERRHGRHLAREETHQLEQGLGFDPPGPVLEEQPAAQLRRVALLQPGDRPRGSSGPPMARATSPW